MQVVPVYPLSHAHCDDIQAVLTNRPMHSEVDVHSLPTTAERDKGRSMLYNISHNANFSFFVFDIVFIFSTIVA